MNQRFVYLLNVCCVALLYVLIATHLIVAAAAPIPTFPRRGKATSRTAHNCQPNFHLSIIPKAVGVSDRFRDGCTLPTGEGNVQLPLKKSL